MWCIFHTNHVAHVLELGLGSTQMKALRIRLHLFFFFFPLLGYSTPNSIWDCQNADEFIVPSHLALFTLSCGVKPLHEEEKYIPSLIGCSAL